MENLYNSLSYNMPEEDLITDITDEEKQHISDAVTTLEKDKKEVVYLLILHDYIISNPNTKVILPYKSKQITPDRLEIKLDALPIKLKRIVLKFCKLAQISGNDMAII